MWTIKNKTPYAAERTWVRDKNGAHHWIVVVKATFDIGANGVLRISDAQVPPHLMPEHHGEPASSSLRYEADLVAEKPTTDILVNAHHPSSWARNEGRPRADSVEPQAALAHKPRFPAAPSGEWEGDLGDCLE